MNIPEQMIEFMRERFADALAAFQASEVDEEGDSVRLQAGTFVVDIKLHGNLADRGTLRMPLADLGEILAAAYGAGARDLLIFCASDDCDKREEKT